ncbi:MAG: hypothetical protein J1E62_01935 [Lachnospiraceae bacterium]|nr:hypothetical protein [Lachnospiraceae bacterium]
MQINESNMYANNYNFDQTDYVGKGIAVKKRDITANDTIEKDKERSDIEAFKALCKKFPNVEFIVVDMTGAAQPEYSGICRTPAFGDLNQVSIMIDKEVVENLENDYENIISTIQAICERYEYETKQKAVASGVEYTALHLHYIDSKRLSCWQIYWPDGAPTVCREEGKNRHPDINTGIKEKNLQAFLRNIQKQLSDKLFEIGESKQEHKAKSLREGVENYREHFVYAKDKLQNKS